MAGGLGRLEHDAEMASTDFDMHERWLTCGRFQSRTQLVSDLCVGPCLCRTQHSPISPMERGETRP